MKLNIFYCEIIILILLILSQQSTCGWSKDLLHDGPSLSIAKAKRAGTFIQKATVNPNYFMWEGHKVEVSESWFERFTFAHDGSVTGIALCFKLVIDGDIFNEARIEDKEGKFIAFGNANAEEVFPIAGVSAFSPHGGIIGRTIATISREGRYSETVHYVSLARLKKTVPEECRLLVGTMKLGDRGPKNWSKSNIILTFRPINSNIK